MTLDQRLTHALRHAADLIPEPDVDLAAVRSAARSDRRRTLAVIVAAASVAAIVTGAALLGGSNGTDAPEPVDPAPSPSPSQGTIVGAVPVWYDDAGLHRGDVVERTPFDLNGADDESGVLALVARGAVYLDSTTGDIWFHPWGGDPHVIGHNSADGPGGDPNGDLAAWSDGAELVVYDTAAEREVSRTDHAPVTGHAGWAYVQGNAFKQVSSDNVLWTVGNAAMYRLDVRTGEADQAWARPAKPRLADIHDDVRVSEVGGTQLDATTQVEAPGQDSVTYPLHPDGARLSPDGTYLLAATNGGEPGSAAIVDVEAGEHWLLPGDGYYPWLSWSYGDVAVVVAGRQDGIGPLLVCRAEGRDCDRVRSDGHVLLPTS